MTVDTVGWLASEARLPLLEEDGGKVSANAVASSAIAGAHDLCDALSRLTGASAEQLGDFVRRARSGLRISERAGRFVLLSVPQKGGAVRVLLVPAGGASGRELAAGLTHELANAFGAILGWASLARARAGGTGATGGSERGGDDDETDRALGLIEQSARTARETARHMLDDARAASAPSEPACVPDVIRAAVAAVEPLAAAADVRLETVLPSDELHVRLAFTDVHTVVSNLLRNAIEASPRASVVAVEAVARRGRVRIEVADQGPGVPEIDRGRVFEPYFTTKAGGTGLGLALVREVVEAGHGRIVVRSDARRGARFVIDLPSAGTSARKRDSRQPPARKRSGVRARSTALDGRILVVDDDEAMRELMATTLELHGATVTTAANATEALAATGPFDVAVVDLGLDVRGDALLAELRRSGAVSLAALVSGSAPTRDLHPDGRPQTWLRKPFDVDELVETVAALHARGSRVAAKRS